MQFKLAALATNLRRLVAASIAKPRFLACTSGSTVSGSVGRTADPNVHAVEPEKETYDLTHEAIPATSPHESEQKSTKNDDPYVPPQSPLHQYSPRIERPAVTPPPDPFTQQRRSYSTTGPTEDISCAGLDVSPWPDDGKGSRTKEDEEDNKEYYEHHKASPLSELEFADTRKPITRATDGTADSYYGGGVILWRPEQIDTAEESLRRATEIWKYNAARGDPDSPQGKVLRALRREYW